MQLVKTNIELEIDGVKYIMRKPKALVTAEFADAVGEDAKISTREKILKTQEFLVSMGMPKDVCEDLDVENLTKIVEFVSKKK